MIRKRDEQLQQRLRQLEEKLDWCEEQLKLCHQENKKLKKDMRFFETMLLEEYHLLLQLLEKDKTGIRLHHL
jgi:septal ring factor EnvC (AmiA/AmiB activator)